MSIWKCGTHGITGPKGCCEDAERYDSADGVEWTLAATPPTPDLDGVREALVRVLREANDASFRHVKALADSLGVQDGTGLHGLADALLAAVSRPTPQAAPEVTEAMVRQAAESANRDIFDGSPDGFTARLAAHITAALRAAATGGRDVE